MDLAEILERGRSEPPSAEAQPNGPSPLLIALAAFVAGVLLARLVSARSRARPRS